MVYVDDRTFTAPMVEESVRIWENWQWHVKALGMKDNLEKRNSLAVKRQDKMS